MSQDPTIPPERDHEPHDLPARNEPTLTRYLMAIALTAVVTFAVVALLISIFQRRQEGLVTHHRLVEVDNLTTDPTPWGQNWPRQYDSYRRTVDYGMTRYGGSDAMPRSKLERYPWLMTMFAGHAFSIDYREARGHAYMLHDQIETERHQRPQPGACLHCHSSPLQAYHTMGNGDINEGFRIVNAMSFHDALALQHPEGEGRRLIEHPVSCVDCHDAQTMALRITRPAFIEGIRALKAFEGIPNYDVNRDATRQEMRTFSCAQCHVEYYFQPPNNQLVYPWARGLRVEQQEEYYESTNYGGQPFADWTHAITGARLLKAQHPEFEMYSQGSHAAAGVSCADCHMPYIREGALKVSDHQVRSPLLMINRSCQTCHTGVSEGELRRRVETIQDRTNDMIKRAAEALVQMVEAIDAAKRGGATDEQLAPALAMHRRASWRIDWVFSEGSHGFHAPQESARILAEAIDFARQGQLIAASLVQIPMPPTPVQPPPLEGVTEPHEGPPHPPERL